MPCLSETELLPTALSRAEKILLSSMKKEAYAGLVKIARLSRIVGAIPGSQEIQIKLKEAVVGIDLLIEAIRARKTISKEKP